MTRPTASHKSNIHVYRETSYWCCIEYVYCHHYFQKMQGPIISQINNEIDECLLQSLFEKSTSNDSKLFCRRATSSSADLEKAHSYVFASSLKGGYESPSSKKETTTKNVKIHQTTEETTPPHYTIFCEERIRNSIGHEIHQLRGVVIWYFGYSTWKGKVMNVDCIVCDNDIAEKLLIYAIVTIAKRLGLGRVVYQVRGILFNYFLFCFLSCATEQPSLTFEILFLLSGSRFG